MSLSNLSRLTQVAAWSRLTTNATTMIHLIRRRYQSRVIIQGQQVEGTKMTRLKNPRTGRNYEYNRAKDIIYPRTLSREELVEIIICRLKIFKHGPTDFFLLVTESSTLMTLSPMFFNVCFALYQALHLSILR